MSTPHQVKDRLLDATDEVARLGVEGCGGVAIQLLGTWSGTVTFEATVEGNTWVALTMFPSNSATGASTATANGVWSSNVAGYTAVQARFSTATSGGVRVTVRSCQASGRW